MKNKIILGLLSLVMMASVSSAEIYPIGAKISLEKNMFGSVADYQNFCDNGYVWRLFSRSYQGSYTQVFKKGKIVNETGVYDTSIPVTCNEK